MEGMEAQPRLADYPILSRSFVRPPMVVTKMQTMSGDNIERLLGTMVAEISFLKKAVNDLSSKVDSLRLWRASMLGASTILGAIAGFITTWITR